MTRKDYILIAAAIKAAREAASNDNEAEARVAAVERTAELIARALHYENARFDYDRFYAACGLSA